MKWASCISTEPRFGEAFRETLEGLTRQLDGRAPDLVIAFVTREFGVHHARLAHLLHAEWPEAVLFGCSASGVIGAGHEIEEAPALSLTAAVLPGVAVRSVHLESSELPPIYAERVAWETALGIKAATEPYFIVIGDPFSFDAEGFLRGLDRAFPCATKIGGLASGAREPGGNFLLLGDTTSQSGAIVLGLCGNLRIETVVAQGCRPIGEPLFVTSCHGNLLRELDGRAPRDVLAELFDRLNARDRALVEQSLFIGIAMPGDRPRIAAGEFLIRNVIGMDAQSGAIWVGAELEPNGIVQFHLRDALSSAEDLERALASASARAPKPSGILLFSCVGRGARLYGSADHDSNALRRHLGELPIGGFFCSGEIGPVQGMSQVHGYTSAVAIITPQASRPQ
jgi:small ligand-binding sensory domain FIST